MKRSDEIVDARIAKDNRRNLAAEIGVTFCAEDRLQLGPRGDFFEFNPGCPQSHCESEWMKVELPGIVIGDGARQDIYR